MTIGATNYADLVLGTQSHALENGCKQQPSDVGKCLNVELIRVGVEYCCDAIGVTADWAVLDVLLMFATTGVRGSIDTTAAVGASVLAEHWQIIGLAEKKR